MSGPEPIRISDLSGYGSYAFNTIKYKVYTLYLLIATEFETKYRCKIQNGWNEWNKTGIHPLYFCFEQDFMWKLVLKKSRQNNTSRSWPDNWWSDNRGPKFFILKQHTHDFLSRALGWEIWKTTFITEISVCVQWELFYDFFFKVRFPVISSFQWQFNTRTQTWRIIYCSQGGGGGIMGTPPPPPPPVWQDNPLCLRPWANEDVIIKLQFCVQIYLVNASFERIEVFGNFRFSWKFVLNSSLDLLCDVYMYGM